MAASKADDGTKDPARATQEDNLSELLDKILNKYVSNYNLEGLSFRQSGQAKVKKEVVAYISTHFISKKAVMDAINELKKQAVNKTT